MNSYYPFGLTFNSYQRVTAKQNDYLYNGKEKQDELDLNWLDYGARMYMPEIGRWGVIDPLAEKYVNYTPYNYALNNPINLIDTDGRAPESAPKPNPIPLITNFSRSMIDKRISSVYFGGNAQIKYGNKSLPDARDVVSRLNKLKQKKSINDLIGKGRSPTMPIIKDILSIPLAYEERSIREDASQIDNANKERALRRERSSEAVGVLLDLDLANATGVFEETVSDQTLMDLANFAMLSKYSEGGDINNFSWAFQGGNSEEYIKKLSNMYEQFKEDKEKDKPKIVNVNKLDGPPIEMDQSREKYEEE